MCYSTTLRKTKEEVEERFRARLQIELEYTPHYHMNGFTHGNLYIVPMEHPDELFPAMWGYVPPLGWMTPTHSIKGTIPSTPKVKRFFPAIPTSTP